MNSELSSIDNSIFDFIYEIAMRDAVLMRAYKGAKKDLAAVDLPKSLVKKYAVSVLKGENPDFWTAEQEIEDAFKQCGIDFTFGNTQKLMNMVMKYLFIRTFSDEAMRGRFAVCHCPMDSIMLKRVVKELESRSASLPAEIKQILKATRKELYEPWSKIERGDVSRYVNFQHLVDFLCSEHDWIPLECDYCLWGIKK